MEEVNALNTDMKIIDPNKDKRFVIRYFEETYLDAKAELEKEGLMSNSSNVVKRIIEKLPEWLPDYIYTTHRLDTDGGIILEIYLKHI